MKVNGQIFDGIADARSFIDKLVESSDAAKKTIEEQEAAREKANIEARADKTMRTHPSV